MSESRGASPTSDAAQAALLLAVDPVGLGGAVLRAAPGVMRDRWMALLRKALPEDAPWRRLPLGIPDSRLIGGLDLVATLAAGRPVAERGVLAEADGGVVIAAMAERLDASTAAKLCAVLDAGEVAVQRDGLSLKLPSHVAVLLLDEGLTAEETPPAALVERLAFRLELDAFPIAAVDGNAEAARARMKHVAVPETLLPALCAAAMAFGIGSLRAPLLALRTARASAALAGNSEITEADAALAVRLVYGPRATRLPAEHEAPKPEPQADNQPSESQQAETAAEDRQQAEPDAGALQDILQEAMRAALPAGLLAALGAGAREAERRAGGAQGRAGQRRLSALRGRPIGTRAGALRAGARLSLVETLRAAAPWQGRRRQERGDRPGPRILVRASDIRVLRFQQNTETTAIFAVDASGSAALNRLAEAKGAVEMLLADCYVRRDQVAVIAFRGRVAELLLPPTSSLVRARRSLAGLPGGGATPLAAGIDAAMALAEEARRRGRTPLLVILTDGRANIARDGSAGRRRAEADALAAAAPVRTAGFATLLVDTAPRPQPFGREVAEALGARYLALPSVDSGALSAAVSAGRRDAS